MNDEEFKKVNGVIYKQLRTLGVQFCDEAFNVFKPGGPDEERIIRNITHAILKKDES